MRWGISSLGRLTASRKVRMRRLLFLFFLFAIGTFAASAQTSSTTTDVSNADIPESPYVLHVTTREVLVDIIAVNARNQPIANLKPADLQVMEEDGPSAARVNISSLHVIDPTAANPGPVPDSGFRIAANESCLQRHTIHYELAYNPGPQGLTVGDHHVMIRATRRGVRLFYRHSYYIGATTPADALRKNPHPLLHANYKSTPAAIPSSRFPSLCAHIVYPPARRTRFAIASVSSPVRSTSFPILKTAVSSSSITAPATSTPPVSPSAT
jgi:hypothetical protein